MAYKLPPLNALRAYEAAARHLSFKLAANELNVTPGAVGQHVKALEATLGVQLFQRLHKSLLLTEAGQTYLPPVRKALRLISEATERLVPKQVSEAINVGVQQSFAVKWFVPRLVRFTEAHPSIEVRVSSSVELEDLTEGRVDVIIRRGLGHQPGLRTDLILAETWFPVCSPALLNGDHPLKRPEDLRHHVLLHRQFREDWRTWLSALGIDDIETSSGPSFTDEQLLLESAIAGQGVALARCSEDLEDGRLVRPFDCSLSTEFAYYLLCPEGAADFQEIVQFREWLLSEAENSRNAA